MVLVVFMMMGGILVWHALPNAKIMLNKWQPEPKPRQPWTGYKIYGPNRRKWEGLTRN